MFTYLWFQCAFFYFYICDLHSNKLKKWETDFILNCSNFHFDCIFFYFGFNVHYFTCHILSFTEINYVLKYFRKWQIDFILNCGHFCFDCIGLTVYSFSFIVHLHDWCTENSPNYACTHQSPKTSQNAVLCMPGHKVVMSLCKEMLHAMQKRIHFSVLRFPLHAVPFPKHKKTTSNYLM